MKDFVAHLHEQDLSEAKKRKTDTAGHAFQRELTERLQASLAPEKRKKITFTSAPAGSTSADIRVTHEDYPNQPLFIECKAGIAQGGALTWGYDGTVWSPSTKGTNAEQICGNDEAFCHTLSEILRSPAVMTRVNKVIARHAHILPDLMTNRVAFTTVPEVWKVVLRTVAAEIQAESFDGKQITWQFPVEGKAYWRTLNSMTHGSHILAIKGMGTLLVGGATFPESWFLPSATLLSAPRIDAVNADAGGMAEARFKRGGPRKSRPDVVERGRRMFIVTGTSQSRGVPPKAGDGIKVIGLDKAIAIDRNPPFYGLRAGTFPIRYVVSNQIDEEYIGRIQEIHSATSASRRMGVGPQQGYEIVCDFAHSARIVTFETNLRLKNLRISSPVSLELRPSIFANCII